MFSGLMYLCTVAARVAALPLPLTANLWHEAVNDGVDQRFSSFGSHWVTRGCLVPAVLLLLVGTALISPGSLYSSQARL